LINESIKAKEVRLVDQNGGQVGVISFEKALGMAKEAELDLVAVAPDSKPPVCRIMNYGKILFDKKKQLQASKKKQKQSQVKEIKLRPGTEEGDYQVKLRNLIRFLKDGDKAKISIRFRGREIAHHDLGMKVMERLQEDLSEYGDTELAPKFEGRQMIMVLAPKKGKK
jgi:translation initiation factor IF-3